MEKGKKGRVCVIGGTGFLGSWLVKRLLEDGFSVNTTTRMDQELKRDVSYLTNLPGASERLKIFNADLGKPETFAPSLEDCVGVFHTAHPLDFGDDKGTEEVKINKAMAGLQGILQACVDSKTVKRVVYTSSITAVSFATNKDGDSGVIDESCWTDVEFVRSLGTFGGSYIAGKTITEKSALDFAEKNGLDLVTVLPGWIAGPFICPHLPDSINVTMALIFGRRDSYEHLTRTSTSIVHVDDVARAHIHVFEYPEAKGRYICVARESSIEELCEFFSTRYPEYQLPTPESCKDLIPVKFSGLSSKKLEETGFKYENGIEKMFDESIKCCKEKGFL